MHAERAALDGGSHVNVTGQHVRVPAGDSDQRSMSQVAALIMATAPARAITTGQFSEVPPAAVVKGGLAGWTEGMIHGPFAIGHASQYSTRTVPGLLLVR